MPVFSVIIPNYNHSSFLKQRINSILSQTFQDFELIILDDASTDNSREIINSFQGEKRITKIDYNNRNSGSPFLQWKKGIELAKSELIWIAESDDYADSRFLEDAYTHLTKKPSAGYYYCDAFIVKEGSSSTQVFSNIKNQEFSTTKWNHSYCSTGIEELNAHLKFKCTVNNISSVVFRKNIVLNFIENFKFFIYHGDWLFYIALSLVSDVIYSNRPYSFYRAHEKSHLHSADDLYQSNAEHFRILQYLISQPSITSKTQLIEYFSFHYLGFGILENGIWTAIKLFQKYRKIDSKLSLAVFFKIIKIKVYLRSREKQHFTEIS